VDLRRAPERAPWELAEAAQLPALAARPWPKLNSRLTHRSGRQNAIVGRAWKRMNLTRTNWMRRSAAPMLPWAVTLICCPSGGQQWALAGAGRRLVQTRICVLLRAVPLRCCRVDLVIRRAFITPDLMELGVTAYLTACGASSAEAARTLEAALARFADALCGHSTIE
jgi:hypothetical protein